MTAKQATGGALKAMNELYQDRSWRAKQLKGEGSGIMGYFCSYTPAEMITAAGLVPFRMMGNTKEAITVADSFLDVTYCPYVRSVFDMAKRGKYDFLEGIVFPTPCDNILNLFLSWQYNMEGPYYHVIELPRVYDQLSLQFFKDELGIWKKSLEDLIGAEITLDKIREAIQLHNETRALLRGLYELRKPAPPLISGAEVIQLQVSLSSLPVGEANELLRGVIEEVKGRGQGPAKKGARLFISGNEIDDSVIIELIEDCGANVVGDDLCMGSRLCWHDVEATEDPLDGLANHYLGHIRCPNTHRPFKEGATHAEEVEFKFGHVKKWAQDCNANGAVIYVIKYCDSQQWDVPDLRDYLKENGFPVLHLEHDYFTLALAPLRTRIEAFVEMVA